MTCILCCYILVLFYCFNIGMSFFTLACNGCVYETFGISKRFPIKLQQLLIRAVPLDKPLTAKCFIHVVSRSVFIFPVILSFNLLLRFCVPCVGLMDLLQTLACVSACAVCKCATKCVGLKHNFHIFFIVL